MQTDHVDSAVSVPQHGRAVRTATLAALLITVVIIIGGGVVRVTGSGLGCPQWPSCTEDSFTSATASTGIHGLIEFANRALTGVVVLAVGSVIAAVWRERTRQGVRQRTLWWSAWAQLLVVLVNAVVGGITVWTGLNPYVVAGHFLAAMLLLTSTAISYDIAHRHRPRTAAHPSTSRLARAVLTAGVPLVVIGAVLTGAGPHPGDSAAVRRIPLDWTLLTVTHGVLAGLVLVLALACAVTAHRRGDDLARLRAVALTGVLLAQSALGIYQSINGLPPLAVVLHLLGAALTWVGVIRLLLASPAGRTTTAPSGGPTLVRA